MATYGPDVHSVEGPVLEQVRYLPTGYEVRSFNNCVPQMTRNQACYWSCEC